MVYAWNEKRRGGGDLARIEFNPRYPLGKSHQSSLGSSSGSVKCCQVDSRVTSMVS